MKKDEKRYYLKYDSNDARSLLSKLESIESDISNIKVNDIISSFENNISSETKARFGNIENYLTDPSRFIKPIISSAIDILSNAIKLSEKIDNEKVDFDLLLLISGCLDINMLSSNYKFDVDVLFEDKMYTMFSQNGYSKDDLLHYFTFIFTDGRKGKDGYGYTVAGASCSMVAFLNGMVELYPLDEVMNMFGLKELPYVEDLTVKNNKSYHSLNESFLLAVNDKLTEEYLKEHPEIDYDIAECVSRGPNEIINDDKIKGIEFAINNNFKDKVNYKIVNGFQNLSFEEKKEINEKLANGEAFIEFRLEKNTNSKTWTHTVNGHYITAVDYKIIDGKESYLIKDSAVNIDIDNSMINSIGGNNKARLAWRSVKELEEAINENSINAIVVSKKEGVNINEWKI